MQAVSPFGGSKWKYIYVACELQGVTTWKFICTISAAPLSPDPYLYHIPISTPPPAIPVPSSGWIYMGSESGLPS